MSEIWGALVVFLLCPLLGGLPAIDWISLALTGRRLSRVGTGNVGVSAAFYHGGRLVGILAVISEAGKGILAVLLTRLFFPAGSAWELMALIALVMGRYWIGKGAGTTNVLWGLLIHDPIAVFLSFLISGVSFTIFRQKTSGRFVALFLVALILILRHPNDSGYIFMAIALASLLGGISARVADDLDLSEENVNPESRKMFRFFRGDRALLSLDNTLDPLKVGRKVATLSYLKRSGYAVPDGWILPAGDDPKPLIESLRPGPNNPLVARSSAIGEDSETASAAGQYTTILDITDSQALESAILTCQTSYNSPTAVQYRLDRGQENTSIAVLVQKQIRGAFSGVAFSRDPVNSNSPDVVIEALPGDATRVVSGRFNPESYRVDLEEDRIIGAGEVPLEIIQQVARSCRAIESLYHGIPQDIEWTHDGEKLWLLQARPITNLQPIWTRKIAAEVIPGVIRPLAWSINRPLTCGVWGEIFTIVLGDRSADLDFTETATLHYGRAYFNATLLGTIFRRMGLPPESLEFLTRGAKFSKPPLLSTVKNIPGLVRLLQREFRLEKDFQKDLDRYFLPTLDKLTATAPENLSEPELLTGIEEILTALKKATYYSILAPLSFAARRGFFKVPFENLDNSRAPEVESLRSLSLLLVNNNPNSPAFQDWLDRYGYLSEAGTDISIPRWREHPETLLQYSLEPPATVPERKGKPARSVQDRLDLKNKVTEIYSRLLAHLRWHFLALENLWIREDSLKEKGDIFFLDHEEIKLFIYQKKLDKIDQIIFQRRHQFQTDLELNNIPYIVYGQPPDRAFLLSDRTAKRRLQGIGASAGQSEGRVKILRTLQAIDLPPETILVVPYTDSGWSPLLSRAAGIISEVGGQLSHGAIVAREYGIPAVMDVPGAIDGLKDGQLVRIDGGRGTVEILAD